MLSLTIQWAILAFSSTLSLAGSNENSKDHLHFDLPRHLLFHSTTQHLLLTGKNATNITVNDATFKVEFRYSKHDKRLTISNPADNHELFKVMCNFEYTCRILQNGFELICLNKSITREPLFEQLQSPKSIKIGNNWTLISEPGTSRVMLFHDTYSLQHPVAELRPFELIQRHSIVPTYTLYVVRQPLFEPALLLAMSIMIDGPL